MGCDGGTIPTRDELVKTKKRPEQVRLRAFFSVLTLKCQNVIFPFSFTFRKTKTLKGYIDGSIVP